jgi:hypothetical protein
MSHATDLLNPANLLRDGGALARFRHRCASENCPNRRKLLAGWRSQYDGIEFGNLPYCSALCAEAALDREIERLLQSARQENRKAHRIPLGLLLVTRGVVTSKQVEEALRLQRENGTGRIGRWLLEIKALTEGELTASLGVQWGCPVFPLEQHDAYLKCASMLPLGILESEGVLPVHHSPETNTLFLAFVKRIDHTLLYAIEQMTGCHASPCVASEGAVVGALERLNQTSRFRETLFDSVRKAREMAATTVNYAAKLQALSIRVTCAANHIWFRFRGRDASHDLLFRLPL